MQLKTNKFRDFIAGIKRPRIKIIDRYIIRKFLGTFFFSILLIIAIAIVFDTAEKLDDFMNKHAPFNAIVFDYYLNFIPYFVVLYSHLFTFISVVFFTSKMAYNTEIVAILGSGVSYKRLLWPYFISATIIALFSFTLMNFVLPNANKVRLQFEEQYIRDNPVSYNSRNIHKQVSPGVVIYMASYNNIQNQGYKFSIEKFNNGKLVSKLMADYINWDSVKHKWVIRDYYIREIRGMKEKIITGTTIDTALNIYPADFKRRSNAVESMAFTELNNYIAQQELQGSESIESSLLERDKRVSLPFATYVLTLIAVCVSSRKVRGGTGLHIGIGLGFCFSYIIFMQFSSQFAISGSLSPLLAVWLPNFVYAGIGYYLYRQTPK
jgi:lipopolysaccharide export system permease protein